ncbi:MAG: glycosyltransferase WbuB, partial [Bacteroidota bacterium]|nr:glycosyltransferase WbuB [Bacteroidota bacterium]
MAKRILIYTNHFYPEQFKINEIVEWISTEDFSVRVVTCIPNYPQGKFYKGYGLKSIRSTFFKDNVIVNRLPLIPRGNANFFLRSLNYISYFISTFFFTIYL